MATFTLFEQMVPGDSTFVPPDPPTGPPLQRSVGDQLIIIDRPLLDKNGNQRGSFVLHGGLIRIFSNVPNLDALLSFQASNTITGRGVINTQGVLRFSQIPAGVTFAIVGGTDDFKKAHGAVTNKAGAFTFKVQ
jgi:hypothetical protein